MPLWLLLTRVVLYRVQLLTRSIVAQKRTLRTGARPPGMGGNVGLKVATLVPSNTDLVHLTFTSALWTHIPVEVSETWIIIGEKFCCLWSSHSIKDAVSGRRGQILSKVDLIWQFDTHFLPFLDYAEKECTRLSNGLGRWFYVNSSRGEWTNFQTCNKVEAHLTQERVHVALYAISVIALTPALIIFFAYS